jgi:hypothetical protein
MLLDGKNNYLLTALVGAGTKNNENKFTGVVMGDLENLDDKNDLYNESGLFGYDKGTQSFGFKTDGTGFIGGGDGRIEFNGSGGIIKGGTKGTLEINLTESTIESSKFQLTSGTKDKDDYLFLSNEGNETVINGSDIRF